MKITQLTPVTRVAAALANFEGAQADVRFANRLRDEAKSKEESNAAFVFWFESRERERHYGRIYAAVAGSELR